MEDGASPLTRCGIDIVELARRGACVVV